MGSQLSIANAINSVVEQSDSKGASSRVVNAIQSAASKTGVNFSYLLQKASQESSFDPSAKSTSSSATGLFQFTTHTWLHMVKTYGDQYGLGKYAAQINDDGEGGLSVDSAAARQAILALRKDPVVSAEMAGELDKENAAALQQKVGGKIGATELYLAHFLGASGASHFIRAMRSNPKAEAANLMPAAAAANPTVFYDKSGEGRSLQQIYKHFAQKFDATGSTRVASLTSKTQAPAGGMSFADASQSQITANLANLMPTDTEATTQTSSADTPKFLQGKTKTYGMTVASAGGSTLLDAMIFGQSRPGTPSALAAFNQHTDNKKKNPYLATASMG